MRLTSLARRSVAVTAAAALISTGGALSGLLAGTALAIGPAPVVSSLSTYQWDNRSSVTLTVTGSNFFAADPTGSTNDTIVFTPDFAQTQGDPTWAPDSTQHTEINYFLSEHAAVSTSTTVLQAKVDFALVPAGLYFVSVQHNDGTKSNFAPQEFTVYGYGGANVTGISAGASNTGTAPFGVDCSLTTNCTPRGAGALDLTGSNIAVGATVQFLKADGKTPDLALHFREGNPERTTSTYAGTGPGTGYASSTLLQGNYSWDLAGNGEPAFTPGLHVVRIHDVHQDASASTTSTSFSQPYFTSAGLSQSTIGQGAQSLPLTVTGQGFTAGAQLYVQGSTCNNAADTTVGQATLGGPQPDGTYTTITAPVSFTSCATGSRAVTVANPSGGYFSRAGAVTVTQAPTFTGISPSSDAILGQGADLKAPTDVVTINGTGFSPTCTPSSTTTCDPAKMTSFDFGPGVTVTTVAVTSSSAAQVNIAVASDAPLGQRSVAVTNPDGGSTTTAPSQVPGGAVPLTIQAGPQITSVTPSSVGRGASGVTVQVKGAFPTAPSAGTPNPYVVTLNGPSPLSVGTATRVDASTLTFPVSVPANATTGLRQLVIKDVTNQGQAVCDTCFAVNSLTVSPTHAANTGTQTLVFTNNDTTKPSLDSALGTSSTITLYHQVPVAGQGPITGTAVTRGAAGSNQASATFNLTNAAPGPYSVVIVQNPTASPQVTWSCAACFTVDPAGTVTVTSITPNKAGQGVSDLPVTIKGTNFSKGMSVDVADVSVVANSVVFVSTTELSARVTVPSDAPIGAKTVTVTPAAGTAGTLANGFTVTAAPQPTSVASGAAYGQGAGTDGTAVSITLNGAHGTFQPKATLSLGSGIGATTTSVTTDTSTLCNNPLPGVPAQCNPDTLTATLTIAQGATTGARDAVVTNPDGGQGTLAGPFTVHLGPHVTWVASELGQPVLQPDGKTHHVTFKGAGFSSSSPATVLDIRNADGSVEYQSDGKTRKIAIANATVVDQGTITADVTVATDAALAPRLVTVKNGSDQGYGTCLSCLAVALPPSAPSGVTTAGFGGALQVSWTGAVPNGSPVTTYVVSLLRSGSASQTRAGACEVSGQSVRYDQLKSLGAFSRSALFTGLTNGATYYVTLCAVNAAGQSTAPTVSGVAGLPDALSIGVSATKIVYGQYVRISGRLLTASGAPLPGRTIVVGIFPAVGRSTHGYAYTSSTGAYSFVWKYAAFDTSVKTFFYGDAAYRPAVSSSRFFYVATRVLRTSPANFSKTAASTLLKITGNVAPATKYGAIMYLYRYSGSTRTLIARTTVTSSNTWSFSIRPGRGTYTFRVQIGNSRGNLWGISSAFTLYRV